MRISDWSSDLCSSDLPLLLSDYHLIIQPNGGLDDPNAGIGTGPYKVASFEPGVRVTFEKNTNDWRDDRGYVESVEIIVINDATARTAALSSGQVNFINRVDPKTVDLLKRGPNVSIQNTSGRGRYVFIMHCTTEPFANNDLRLALKYAMNREAMVATILRGLGGWVEFIVINDATARTAALTSGQVNFITRVDPKTVDLLKRGPNVSIQNTSGRGRYVFIMHCNTEPFANNDLRLALKYAMNREAMVETILRGFGKVGNDFPINETYALFPQDIEQRAYDPDKAAFHFKKSGHSGSVLLRTSEVAFPGAVDARSEEHTSELQSLMRHS